MSTQTSSRRGQAEPSDGPAAPLPLQVGIDPLYSDCVIKTSSGLLYYTLTGVLISSSPVFKDLVHCCGQVPSSDEVGQEHDSSSTAQKSPNKHLIEIPLPDPEEQIKTLVEHLHQPYRFLGSIVPVVTKEGAAKVLHLAPIAFKYNMQGDMNSLLTNSQSALLATELKVLNAPPPFI
jgi:hypothetical protein